MWVPLQVRHYSAEMSVAERKAVHQAFLRDDVAVVVATLAFGMGEQSCSCSMLSVAFLRPGPHCGCRRCCCWVLLSTSTPLLRFSPARLCMQAPIVLAAAAPYPPS